MEEVFAPADDDGPKTVRVLVARVEPKRANALLKRLHTLLPTPEANLGHLKRVKRDRASGALAAILSTPDRYAALEEQARSELEAEFSLSTEEAEVPRLPARSREEQEEMSALWPMTYHGVVEVIRKEEAALTDAEVQAAERYLQMAIDDALQPSLPPSWEGQDGRKKRSRPPRHGAVIVNPANDEVIVTARAARAALLASGKGRADHPLHHCIMLCVDGVAGLVAPQPTTHHFSSSSASDKQELRAKLPDDQYVCTGLDAYLTHEPCVMCAMALVHSRIRRVFYCLAGAEDGALGTHYHVHAMPSLNHRFRVFRAPPHLAQACRAAAVVEENLTQRYHEAVAALAWARAEEVKRRQEEEAVASRRAVEQGRESALPAAMAGLTVGKGDRGGQQESAAASGPLERPPPLDDYMEAHASATLICPVSLQLLEDPVLLAGDGCTYSRFHIEQHFAARRSRGLPLTSPTTNLELDAAQATLFPNVTLRGLVLEYREAKTREWETAERQWREWAKAQEK